MRRVAGASERDAGVMPVGAVAHPCGAQAAGCSLRAHGACNGMSDCHRRWDVALRLTVTYGEAALSAGILTLLAQGGVGRGRPLLDANVTFVPMLTPTFRGASAGVAFRSGVDEHLRAAFRLELRAA